MSRPTYKELEALMQQYSMGNAARVNHYVLDPSCGGESKSLKIQEAPNGGLTYKCFRCGLYGTAYPSAVAQREARRRAGERIDNCKDTVKAWRYTFPQGRAKPQNWSRYSVHWLLQYVTLNTAKRHGVVEAYDRLWLPVCKDGQPVKWAGRRLYPYDRVKYLTGQAPGYKVHDPVWPIDGVKTGPLVVTEDVVSAWAVTEKLHLSAYPIMGSHMDKWQVNYVT